MLSEASKLNILVDATSKRPGATRNESGTRPKMKASQEQIEENMKIDHENVKAEVRQVNTGQVEQRMKY